MRRDHDRFAVLDVWLKALQRIGAGPFEAINSVDAFASEIPVGSFIGLSGTVNASVASSITHRMLD
jgi:hypothetical protein